MGISPLPGGTPFLPFSAGLSKSAMLETMLIRLSCNSPNLPGRHNVSPDTILTLRRPAGKNGLVPKPAAPSITRTILQDGLLPVLFVASILFGAHVPFPKRFSQDMNPLPFTTPANSKLPAGRVMILAGSGILEISPLILQPPKPDPASQYQAPMIAPRVNSGHSNDKATEHRQLRPASGK